MAINRYVKDYRLVETFNEKGRVRTEYEYIGEDYWFTAGAASVRKAKGGVTAGCVLAWLSFIAALWPVSTAMHTIYTAFPFAFSALPLGLLTKTALALLGTKEPMEHRQADAFNVRWPLYSLSAVILVSMALAGILINLIRGLAFTGGDAVFMSGAALLWLCCVFCFRQRRQIAAESRK